MQFVETLWTADGEGAALGNTLTATSLLPATAKPQFNLGQLLTKVGDVLRLTAQGRVSNIVTTPGTLTLDLRMGTGPVIVFNGGAMALNIVAKTNVSWWLEMEVTLRSKGTGTAAQFIGKGGWWSESVIGAAATAASVSMLPATSTGTLGTGFDSTSTSIIDLFGAWSVANAGNTITLEQAKLYKMTSS